MDEIPPCDIKIDKDGIWYYGEEEIFRKEIVQLFYQNLKQDQSGRYLIELGAERCYIEVEDTPFVVKSVYRTSLENDKREVINIYLSDGTLEELNPDTLLVGKDNVLYCSVRREAFRARFSRAGYYQIATYIEYNTENNEYFISLNGNYYYIKKSLKNDT